MSKKSDRIMAGILFGGAAVGVIAFACWRMNVNSYSRQKYVAMYFEESKAAEESKKESEKAEEEAFWAMPTVMELTLEQTSVAEVMTEMSLPTEALTECPVTHENGAETAEPTVVEEILAEPSVEPLRPLYAFTAEDEDLLLRVASCEAGNQGVLGIALVMRVVLNRAEVYNMSIKDVILAPRQFSVVGCDKWNNGYIAPDAYEALDCIKNGWDDSQGALFFCAPWANAWHRSAKQYLFTAGGHEFYK